MPGVGHGSVKWCPSSFGPLQQGKLAQGIKDEEHGMSAKFNSEIAVIAFQGTHHLRRRSARISDVRSVSARPRPLPGLWGQGQLGSTRCRWAGRDGDAEHLGDGGVWPRRRGLLR